MVDRAMLDFVKSFIEERDPTATKIEFRYPFRRLYDHCYRVYRWAQRIRVLEGGDRDVVEVSALFHDIGKCVDTSTDGHALEGARICRTYLDSIGFDGGKTDRIAGIIADHIHHCRGDQGSVEARVASDADLLDEMGAMTVLWDCMGMPAEEKNSYKAAYAKIKGHLEKYSTGGGLLTEAGTRFLMERIAFLGLFVRNLEFELGLAEGCEAKADL